MKITKNIQYNILSLINVLIGFLFIILLGREFGASYQTDIYFISLVIISYLCILINVVWSAIKNYYIEIKTENKKLANEYYNILFNNIIISSLIIIFFYFIITNYFDIISYEKKIFLDIFIIFILTRSLINFNKTILNLEHYYAQVYIVELIINLFNLFTIFLYLNNNIQMIAYATILSSFIALSYQMYLVYFQLKIKYQFKLSREGMYHTIYKNSFKLNLGGLLYLSKDLLIINVLTTYGNGVYSLFSYANKFVGVILQVVNAPIFNIFVTNITHLIANKKYYLIKKVQKEILIKLSFLYISASIFAYFALPLVLKYLFSNKFSYEEINNIQYIFIFLIINYLIVTIEGPYLTVINLFKKFNYVLFVNLIFSIMMIIGYSFFNYLELEYTYFFIFLILSQFGNSLFYIYKYEQILRKKHE